MDDRDGDSWTKSQNLQFDFTDPTQLDPTRVESSHDSLLKA